VVLSPRRAAPTRLQMPDHFLTSPSAGAYARNLNLHICTDAAYTYTKIARMYTVRLRPRGVPDGGWRSRGHGSRAEGKADSHHRRIAGHWRGARHELRGGGRRPLADGPQR